MTRILTPNKRWESWDDEDKSEDVVSQSPEFGSEFVRTLLTFIYNRMEQTMNTGLFTAANNVKFSLDHGESLEHPMNLDILRENINTLKYKSLEAFYSDAKLLVQNCSGDPEKRQHISKAQYLLNICREEILKVETCFECYYKANSGHGDWFIDICSTPHVLLWAKLRTYPFWPAKAMNFDGKTKKVQVYFFGDHTRSWIDIKNCYLYSEEYPIRKVLTQKKFEKAIREMYAHIEKLSYKFGDFKYAPKDTAYDPTKEKEQLGLMLPNIERMTETNAIVHGPLTESKPKISPMVDNTLESTTSETNGFQIPKSVKKRRQTMPVTDLSDQNAKKVKYAVTKGYPTNEDQAMEEVASTSAGAHKKATGKRRMTFHQTSRNVNQSPVQPRRCSDRIKSRTEIESATSQQAFQPTPVVSREIIELPDLPRSPGQSCSRNESTNLAIRRANFLSRRRSLINDFVYHLTDVVINDIVHPIRAIKTKIKQVKQNVARDIADMKQKSDIIKARLCALENRVHHG